MELAEVRILGFNEGREGMLRKKKVAKEGVYRESCGGEMFAMSETLLQTKGKNKKGENLRHGWEGMIVA